MKVDKTLSVTIFKFYVFQEYKMYHTVFPRKYLSVTVKLYFQNLFSARLSNKFLFFV